MRLTAMVLVVLAAVVGPSRAQESLSLKQAVARALATHPEAAVAQAGVDRARADRIRARLLAPSNPVISASLTDDERYADEGEWTDSVLLSQELWVPGQRGARIRAAEAGIAAAESLASWTRQRLIARTATAFARLEAGRRKEATLEELLALLSRLDEIAVQRLSAGDISEYERQRVQVEGATGRAELLLIRTATAEARERLAALVGGLPDEVALEAAPEPLPWSTFAQLPAASAVADRYDVVAAREAARRAEALVRVERRERLPRPTLSVGVENERSRFDGEDFKGLPFDTEAVSVADTDRFLVLELSFALPILDPNRGGVAAAIAEAAAARAEADLATRQAASDVRLLLARGEALAQAHVALREGAELARDNIGLIERAYEAGKVGLTDFIVEKDRGLRARLQLADVEADLVETQLDLAASAGALGLFGLDEASLAEVTP